MNKTIIRRWLPLIPSIYQFFKRSHHKQQSTTSKSQILKFDLTIIGGGPGSLSLASDCAQLGLKVALLESGKMGGDCLNYGCVALLAAAKTFYHAKHGEFLGIHSKELTVDFQQVMQHVHQVIANLAEHDSVRRFESFGVKVIQAEGRFLSPNTLQAGDTVIQSNYFVIATGSSPVIPFIPKLDQISYLTNETIFSIKEKPKHLIVIGGGPIGCELAQAFAMLGSEVTLLDVLNILPNDDADCVAIVHEQLEKMDIAIYEQIKELQIKSYESPNITVSFKYQNTQLTISGSHLLIAAGRQVNINSLDLDKANVKYTSKAIAVNARLQTSNKKIYAIGDVTGAYQFTHMAEYHAGVVLRNLVFKIPSKVDYRAVPWVTYTDPELAHVGMLAAEALKRSNSNITEWSFVDNDRAQTERTLKGKIKIVTDKKGKILGVTIVGPHAGELILPWVMAIRERKRLRTFTDVIIPYPTLSEISKRVAGAFYKPKLFSNKTRTLVRWLQKLG